ncbi:uncharacterized protein LOC107612224 isoform X2 [Arachis ipaensis]|uniref:uncharacterized protein LOC107612224 isoform X2 n=1 Tax=Arachis ipaensis TaxID=130454 RepID=UPI0007AF5939|nr:uncharacterized protein LOC107612224 isoform X2 [Arachis ipaensis]XP_025672091.1 vascular-related unknown protein 4 isoform X2 [Arachis hypogaea]
MSSISETPSSFLTTKNITGEDDDESPEESGWTTYFEDFFNNNNNNHSYCSTILSNNNNNLSSSVVDCCCCSSSLVSDAASLYATKFVDDTVQGNNKNNNKELSTTMRLKKGSRSGSMKRNKNTRKGFIDDALEDTASSPLNSPKEKGNGSGIRDERKELGFKKRDSDYTELNKKGCLVPLSMHGNKVYLG